MGLPLEGVTVLEFIHTVMGPAYGVVLADLVGHLPRNLPFLGTSLMTA